MASISAERTADKQSQDQAVRVPPLLPIPPDLHKPGDELCGTCKALDLSPSSFVVLPGDIGTEGSDTEASDKPDIQFGLVEDIRNKPNCPFCRLVLTAFGPGLPSNEDGQPVFVKLVWSTDGPVPDRNKRWVRIPQIRTLMPYALKGEDDYVPGVNLFPEITLLANDAPDSSKKTFFPRFIKDQIDFSMVRNWLTACKSWHGDACDKSMMLGDTAEDPSVGIPNFRLVDVIDNAVVPGPPNAEYVTLSYIWGSVDRDSILQLRKDNVAELARPGALLQPKNWDRISLTIRDAMQVVRELNFRYMWVDTLCILQDDVGPDSSKSGAIKKMDLIYGASYLTIMAATGKDANAGLPGLHPHSRGTVQPIEEILPGLRLGFRQRFQNYIADSVYYTRAWPYQEQQFSKRSLIFIGGQVVYRCSGADQWREDVFFEDSPTHPSPIASSDSADDIGDYEGLIQTYSGLSLSYDSDIYHAFGGLTRYFKRSLQVNLCHGIPDAYFDWFLLWTSLAPQTRRPGTPSWSWSGWKGTSWPHVWDWYNHNTAKVKSALKQRTWVIWYQRKAHDSEEFIRVYTPKNVDSSSPTNFYGAPIKPRFPFDTSQTTPTPRKLINIPSYFEDSYNPSPGSGFLQFWTVSATFRLAKSVIKDNSSGPLHTNTPLGIFGLDADRQLGTISVNPDWASANIEPNQPNEFEFILLCEGRDKRAERGKQDEEDGWRYMVMLIEWHQGADNGSEWAERIGQGSIGKDDLDQALGTGASWKEIILG